MSAMKKYNEFLKKEANGQYVDAWTQLMLVLYSGKDKDYKDVLKYIYTSEWYEERKRYLDMNDSEWRMTIACLFDDAESREDGIICYLAWQILNHNYRWYNSCAGYACMSGIVEKYSDWEEFKDAMEIKAKRLGFSVHK